MLANLRAVGGARSDTHSSCAAGLRFSGADQKQEIPYRRDYVDSTGSCHRVTAEKSNATEFDCHT